ncbi:hypothetical protein LCGC14_1046000 [marine sediment metagenome]|uniref:Uncharacterized protein n=2 Tax=marine sediment metagenome TaxID=412755 RepID=A0A0F9MQD4_9ZZZZ
MTTIDSSVFLGLLGLPPKDIAELINIASAVCHCGKMDVDTKILMSMRLMNSGAKLFESVGGSSYMSNFHPIFQTPIEYQTDDTNELGENFES